MPAEDITYFQVRLTYGHTAKDGPGAGTIDEAPRPPANSKRTRPPPAPLPAPSRQAEVRLDGDTTLSSAIVCPLEQNGRIVGALALYHVDPSRYTDDHGRLLAVVAEQTAAVVGNSLVFEQTQEESLTDPLTGLPNRRSLASRLSSEIARAERTRGGLAVIVLDVDGFKQINDTHGHSAGDLVLREIARTLRGSLRTYDMCVRYAGDEFVVLLGDCQPDRIQGEHAVE